MTNYNEKYTQLTTELRKCIRLRKSCDTIRFAYNGVGYDVADRQDRILLIKRMSNDYMAEHAAYNQRNIDRWVTGGCRGERPKTIDANTALLESLTDAILDEELNDTNPGKATDSEYPFLSEMQLARRRDGVHVTGGPSIRGEAAISALSNYGTDGRDYREPTRRWRSKHECMYLDRHAKIRNASRAAQYRKDTAAGPVVTYNLRETGGELSDDFVQCSELSGKWRKYIDQSEEIS